MNNINTVGVIGAGQMGAGIAQVSAEAGFEVILWDSYENAVAKGLNNITAWLSKSVEKQKITSEKKTEILKKILTGKSIQDFSKCDLVIEAVQENTKVKTDLFTKLSEVVSKNCILASNTSSISITKLASVTKNPENFVGIHFMNPVPLMKLVELIRGLQTSDNTYNLAKDYCNKINKTTVLALDAPGFIVNRVLCPMINEAFFLLQAGAEAKDIDNAIKLGLNHPMGPLELADFVGLDTLLYILQVLHSELGEDKYRPCPLLVKYVEAGWYGKKSGKGVNSYRS